MGVDLAGRVEVPAITANHTGLTASTVAESVNLLDAVRAEGKSRRLVTMLMLLSFAAETTEPKKEVAA